MDLKLTNFVNINIKNHESSAAYGTYDTAALVYYDSTATANSYQKLASPSKTEAGEAVTGLDAIAAYVNAFFDNGGRYLYVIRTATLNNAAALASILEELPMEYLLIGFVCNPSGTQITENTFRTYAAAWNTAHDTEKIYQKIFVCEVPYSLGTVDDLANYSGGNKVSIENYVLKYGALGIGASVLAYYTKLELFRGNAAQDYSFTTEVYGTESTDHFVFTNNALVTAAIDLDINIDSKLAGQIKNLGGNDTAGYDLTNQVMLLVLHQVLTNSLISLLASKIKYDAYGSALVLNRAISELSAFVSNGYLNPGKVWTDPDLFYKGYKMISKNEILNKGFKVQMLPFSSLSKAERDAKQLPEIFILIADSYSIRKIVISGEVF